MCPAHASCSVAHIGHVPCSAAHTVIGPAIKVGGLFLLLSICAHLFFLERRAGIEPAPWPWKGHVLPLNYRRITPPGLSRSFGRLAVFCNRLGACLSSLGGLVHLHVRRMQGGVVNQAVMFRGHGAFCRTNGGYVWHRLRQPYCKNHALLTSFRIFFWVWHIRKRVKRHFPLAVVWSRERDSNP